MPRISFTYSTVTPESAELGDLADSGFYDGMYQYSVEDYEQPEYQPGDLRGAIELARSLGIFEDSGSWFSSVDPDIDYSDGSETFYSFHISGITPATYARISRLLLND